jgi:thymidylate synthase (FAD)
MPSKVKLVWITPDAEKLLVHMARVSNPRGQEKGLTSSKLLQYLKKNKHWSPFEMVHACVEVDTTRDIAHQILRHRSYSFQEFSQRYASTDALPEVTLKEARLQDATNRQHSIETDDEELQAWWRKTQREVIRYTQKRYKEALRRGLAKECARVVLPEGLTPTRMYMVGSVRSWIHYLDQRCVSATQKEHRLIAQQIEEILRQNMPVTFPRKRRR